jgi:hypothetical protein
MARYKAYDLNQTLNNRAPHDFEHHLRRRLERMIAPP